VRLSLIKKFPKIDLWFQTEESNPLSIATRSLLVNLFTESNEMGSNTKFQIFSEMAGVATSNQDSHEDPHYLHHLEAFDLYVAADVM